MKTTTQALRFTASWTPTGDKAKKVAKAIGSGPLDGIAIYGGRMSLRIAFATDFTEPSVAVAITKRISSIKTALQASGTLHGATTTACRVPIEDAVSIAPEAAA